MPALAARASGRPHGAAETQTSRCGGQGPCLPNCSARPMRAILSDRALLVSQPPFAGGAARRSRKRPPPAAAPSTASSSSSSSWTTRATGPARMARSRSPITVGLPAGPAGGPSLTAITTTAPRRASAVAATPLHRPPRPPSRRLQCPRAACLSTKPPPSWSSPSGRLSMTLFSACL